MIDQAKLQLVIDAYCRDFSQWWPHEQHKLSALVHFRQHWDLAADDFVTMYQQATAQADKLLVADSAFPGGMIVCFAKMAERTTKEAFIGLLDEQQELEARIDAFTTALKLLLNQFAVDNPNWSLNIKQAQSISSYLYLAYPDRYYVYHKEMVAHFAQFLNEPLKLSESLQGRDLVAIFAFFDAIKPMVSQHPAVAAIKTQLIAQHHLSTSLALGLDNLITWDLSCYYSRHYQLHYH